MPHIKGPSGAENAWRKLDCKISEIKISSMKHDAPLLAFLFWEDSFNNANKWCSDCCRCIWKFPSQSQKWGSYIRDLGNRGGCDGILIYLIIWLSITNLSSMKTLVSKEPRIPMLLSFCSMVVILFVKPFPSSICCISLKYMWSIVFQ